MNRNLRCPWQLHIRFVRKRSQPYIRFWFVLDKYTITQKARHALFMQLIQIIVHTIPDACVSYASDACIHLRRILHENRPTWHWIKMQHSNRDAANVCVLTASDLNLIRTASMPILHNIDTGATNARTWCKLLQSKKRTGWMIAYILYFFGYITSIESVVPQKNRTLVHGWFYETGWFVQKSAENMTIMILSLVRGKRSDGVASM